MKISKKAIDYINETFDTENLFDFSFNSNNDNTIYLVWKDTEEIFAQLYIDQIEKAVELEDEV